MANQWLIMVNNGQPMIAGTLLWNRQDLSKLFLPSHCWPFSLSVTGLQHFCWWYHCEIPWNPSLMVKSHQIHWNPSIDVALVPTDARIKRPWKSGLWRCWSACCRGTCRDFDLPNSPGYLGKQVSYQVFYQTPRCLPVFFLYPQVCSYKRKQDWGLVKQQLQILEYLSCI